MIFLCTTPAPAKADVSTNSPSSTAVIVAGWVNPTNAYADDAAYANSTTSLAAQQYGGYIFNLLSGSTVSQVRVRLDAWCTGNDDIKLEVSADGGATYLPTSSTVDLDTSETTYWVDVTGWTTWTTENLNGDNIRTKVTHDKVGALDEIRLDWIPVEVTYTPPFSFYLRASIGSLSTKQTISVSTTVTVTHVTGTTTTVSLDGSWVGTTPGGVSRRFSPSSGAPSFTSTLTFDTTADATIGTYTYRITGTGGGQTYFDDVILNITQLLAPGAPSPASPENGVTIDTLTPTFDWADVTGATSYTLQVATDNNFSNVMLTKNQIESTATPSETEKLSYGTLYYWRVRGTNAAGSGGWSSTWSLTATLTAPKVTALEVAAGATYTNSTTVQLSITAQNADEMSFSSDGVVWGDWESYQTSKSYPLSGPDGSKNIYIRVKDNTGAIGQTSAGSIILDQTPSSTAHSLSGDLSTEGYKGSVVVTLTATDATSSVENTNYRVDDGEWKMGDTFVISSEGTHTVEYYSTDAAGNLEGTKSFEVTVYTPTTLPPILTQYWLAWLGVIVGAGVGAVFVTRRVRLAGRLKRITREKREVIKLMKEAETRYYKEGSITRDSFDELIRGHEKRLAELEKEERVLKAKAKKVAEKKVKKRVKLKKVEKKRKQRRR